jgi:hypothetical protein
VLEGEVQHGLHLLEVLHRFDALLLWERGQPGEEVAKELLDDEVDLSTVHATKMSHLSMWCPPRISSGVSSRWPGCLLIRGRTILWRLAEGKARIALLSTLSARGVWPSRKVLAEASSFRKRKALSEAMLVPWILITLMSTLAVPLLLSKEKCPHRPCRRRARAISVMASLTKVPSPNNRPSRRMAFLSSWCTTRCTR